MVYSSDQLKKLQKISWTNDGTIENKYSNNIYIILQKNFTNFRCSLTGIYNDNHFANES